MKNEIHKKDESKAALVKLGSGWWGGREGQIADH